MLRTISERLFFAFTLLFALGANAETTLDINPESHSAWGANIGWINGRADGFNGAVIGDYVCSGSLYSANVGWISLGHDTPLNGIHYSNAAHFDFGVNHDGVGKLRGFAFSANMGWINFEDAGNPRIDLQTGVLNGYAWSANAGWISLSNAVAAVKTERLDRGKDIDGDFIADAWEYTYSEDLSLLNQVADSDGDGASDLDEYWADTDPLDPDSSLRITDYHVSFGANELHELQWNSRMTRHYRIQYRTAFAARGTWLNTVGTYFPQSNTNTAATVPFAISGTAQRYFRVRAQFPLSP